MNAHIELAPALIDIDQDGPASVIREQLEAVLLQQLRAPLAEMLSEHGDSAQLDAAMAKVRIAAQPMVDEWFMAHWLGRSTASRLN